MIDQAEPDTTAETNTDTNPGTGTDERPTGFPCPDCTHFSVSRHTAWLAGDHSKATDYTVLLRRHWRSAHCV
ncbi:hypothetical protein AF335_09820 [Streptomyces eurocidicus]|uniref:Putative RNA-binding Zn-ribbon protein involved in translation (DUF1610 family) n=1 Tax=Streptomyces eurocidicus TaxID=66423 RepID=A0A2N8NWU3_STREU|nr:hypothetical protein [Streptomyces eurocidicus]MBB5117977.1 putative RNA-binding Zn-ribbon protein involved in translation (DUF1610 family) [Streptomyces eurocidicus]MBF6053956.1 hypothetical protein [Streptomyces eurocidicus]PNE33222.1 hypothetical protein AF335_09820 [Streptomyces eurocidicus]